MSTYHIVIVDDEPLARKVIKDALHKIEDGHYIKEEGDPIKALKYIEQNEVDILYLDINMPVLSGIDVASKINTDVITVFTTAYEEYALKAFELAAFDYLVKPIGFARFLQSYERIKDALASEGKARRNTLFIKESRRTYRLTYESIYRLQAYGDYVKIFTEGKVYVVKSRLSDYEKQLDNQFIKVHRSHIVHVDHISYMEGAFLHVAGENIPISDSFLPIVQLRMQNL